MWIFNEKRNVIKIRCYASGWKRRSYIQSRIGLTSIRLYIALEKAQLRF